MKNKETIYNKLREEYSDKEIAEAMVIPKDTTTEEEAKLKKELVDFRINLLKKETEEQRVKSDLLRFKFQLEDYIAEGEYIEANSFGNALEEYTRILKRTKKRLSEDLGVHYTRLSRIINNREEGNIELTFRLEKHSGGIIPALFWWKLIMKKQEYYVKQDKETRDREWKKVQGGLEM